MRMNRALTEALWMKRFSEVYGEVHQRSLSCADAALILGCSARHFLRLRERFDDEGHESLADRRVGPVSQLRAANAVEVSGAREVRFYKARLGEMPAISHLTVEVLPAPSA